MTLSAFDTRQEHLVQQMYIPKNPPSGRGPEKATRMLVDDFRIYPFRLSHPHRAAMLTRTHRFLQLQAMHGGIHRRKWHSLLHMSLPGERKLTII